MTMSKLLLLLLLLFMEGVEKKNLIALFYGAA